MVERVLRPAGRVRIAVVGKYTALHDAYKSVSEALLHGGIEHNVGVDIEWIESDRFIEKGASAKAILADFDGLLVPGGFGNRGIEGMIEAIQYARTSNLPFFL